MNVTVNKLAKIIGKETNSRKVGLTYKKTLDMYKKNNPFHGRVEVLQNVRGHINAKYSRSVEKVTGRPHVSKGRSWGTRKEGTPLVTHKGNFYMEVRCEGKSGEPKYFLDGEQINNQKMIADINKHRKPEKKEPVVIRDFKLDSLTRLRMGGVEYFVKKAR